MYRESVLGSTMPFYVATFVLVFIAVVLIYLPNLFRFFGLNRKEDRRSPKERKDEFSFATVNVFVLLLLAVVFAVLATHF